MAFYTLVVMTTVLGVVFLLDFTVFVYKRCHPPVKEEDEEDEDETDEGEMKQVPPSDKTAMIDNWWLCEGQMTLDPKSTFCWNLTC